MFTKRHTQKREFYLFNKLFKQLVIPAFQKGWNPEQRRMLLGMVAINLGEAGLRILSIVK